MSSGSSNGTRATPQGGVFDGVNPAAYSASQPVNTLIIQAGIIIIFCRLLHFPLQKLRQPRVIAEVLGGVLLGPSVMGRIPGFTAAVFPKDSMATLNATANIGLILFLFLVGLEADFRFLASNWKVALSVGALGMVIPFGLGAALAVGIYNTFNHEQPGLAPVSFGVFILFVGVAMAITAFPVLCRILTELKLLRTKVGIIVLSAGVGNDVVGWVLLALCVALVNAGTGLAALWIILTAIGYCLFLFYGVRPAFVWYLRKTNSFQNGPSQTTIALTVLMVIASAFFTGAIGIHPIFGGFMIGLICPHDGGFAVKVTEKIEDLVSVLFLPLYFALSGINTNLGLLNSGTIWGYVIAILAVAFVGKITGGTLAARANGMVWRESFTIGTLMSCKGLVELIVLNIGLQAKILTNITFTMFVVMALVTTFATTPLVSWLYPRSYQIKLEAWKRGEIDWDTGAPIDGGDSTDASVFSKSEKSEVSKVLAYLRLDNLPGMLTLLSLMARPVDQKEFRHPDLPAEEETDETEQALNPHAIARSLRVHGVRLNALSDRDSSVMHITELDEHINRDPLLNTINAFGSTKKISVSGSMLVAAEPSFSEAILERAVDVEAELMVLPWSMSGSVSEEPLETPVGVRERFSNGSFSNFIRSAAADSACATAVFVDNGFGTNKINTKPLLSRTVTAMSDRSVSMPALLSNKQGHHIFLPFFGSEDDRLALRLVLQLAQDRSVTATIVHFRNTTISTVSSVLANETTEGSAEQTTASKTQVVVSSGQVATAKDYEAFFATLKDTISDELKQRVVFKTVAVSESNDATAQALEMASEQTRSGKSNRAGDLVVLGHSSSSVVGAEADVLDSDARKTLGDLAGSIIGANVRASLLVVRAAKQ